MDTLSLEFARQSTHVVMLLRGRLDGISASAFNAFVAEHLLPTDAHVTLECTGLSYVSSAGLREFLMLAKRAAKLNGKVTLAGAGGSVAFALEMAGFNALFTLSPSLGSGYSSDTPDGNTPGTTERSTGLLQRLFSSVRGG
jgi:anti-anti-sigma factor